MPTRRRHPVLVMLLIIVLLVCVPLTMPWAFHMGGRWTPLMWWGYGRLVAKGGIDYPLFVTLYPSPHPSRLRLYGQRPTGGLQGSACLCTAPGAFQLLNLTGTIYDTWWSTAGSQVAFRLLERTIVNVGQKRAGFFDMVGHWNGPELVMEDRSSWSSPFRSGMRIEHASVDLRWSPFWSCKAACASVTNYGSAAPGNRRAERHEAPHTPANTAQR
jgi:hypothetical protein